MNLFLPRGRSQIIQRSLALHPVGTFADRNQKARQLLKVPSGLSRSYYRPLQCKNGTCNSLQYLLGYPFNDVRVILSVV
jgi:hypothetical protein